MSAIIAGSKPYSELPPRLGWAAVVLIFLIGLRVEVGGDWFVYIFNYNELKSVDFLYAIGESDPAYALVSWTAAQLGLGIWAVNVVCATIFTAGLIALARTQPNPQLALLVAIPYLVIVVAMGYTRQSAALGLLMLALVQLFRGATVKVVVSLLLAAAFHRSAVIAIPLILIASSEKRLVTAAALLLLMITTYYLFLSGETDRFVGNYVTNRMNSLGAGVRIAMNAVSAALLLGFRKQFNFDPRQLRLWIIFSLASFLAIAAYLLSPSSTAIDRLALYLIPIQIVVLSRLPGLFARADRPNMSIVTAIVAYSLAVQLVWLTFGQFAWAWLPYQNYLWTPTEDLEGFHRY